jgi:hypothetical protein
MVQDLEALNNGEIPNRERIMIQKLEQHSKKKQWYRILGKKQDR